MNDSPGAAGPTVAEPSASIERLLALGGEPEAVARIEKRWIGGAAGKLRVWLYAPAGVAMGLLPALVYFHGGGFVAGSLETHDGICRSLANASGCRVVAVDYRLGPDAPVAAAVLDACSATRWIAQHAARFGIDSRAIGVCGDATGATLAAVVAQTFAAQSGPPLALQFLLCPVLEHGADIPSPLEAKCLEGLPPACIHTAASDPLCGQGVSGSSRRECECATAVTLE